MSAQTGRAAGAHSEQRATAAHLNVIRHGRARKASTHGRAIRKCCSLDIPQLLYDRRGAHSCNVANYCAVNMHGQVLRQPRRHECPNWHHTESAEQTPEHSNALLRRRVRDNVAAGHEVVQQATRRAVRGVYGAHEAERLWEELSNGRSADLHEVSPAMNRPEVRDVPEEVQLLGNDGEACIL